MHFFVGWCYWFFVNFLDGKKHFANLALQPSYRLVKRVVNSSLAIKAG